MVLLDTNICIYLLNQAPGYEAILHQLDGREQGSVLLSAITLAELQFGIAASQPQVKNRERFGLFFAAFEAAPFDNNAAAAYGNIRAYLQSRGTPIGPLDTLIAAQAVSLKATLIITNNVREFSRVPELNIENWLVPSKSD